MSPSGVQSEPWGWKVGTLDSPAPELLWPAHWTEGGVMVLPQAWQIRVDSALGLHPTLGLTVWYWL